MAPVGSEGSVATDVSGQGGRALSSWQRLLAYGFGALLGLALAAVILAVIILAADHL